MQNVKSFSITFPRPDSLHYVLELCFCSYDDRHISSSTQYVHGTHNLDEASQEQTPFLTGEQGREILKCSEQWKEVFPLNQRFCCQVTIIRCPACITALWVLQGVITCGTICIFTGIWISSLQELFFSFITLLHLKYMMLKAKKY